MKMRFAVVGHGFMGPRHVGLLNSMKETQCVAVCDTDPVRLEGLDESIARYTDFDEMVANEDLFGVVIASPNKVHKQQAIAAANAGLHVLCEKPAAMSVGDFDKMAEAARRNGVLFTVHQQRRFDRDFQTVKQAYERGLLGGMFLIQSQMYGFNGNMHDWHVYKSEGGGMMFDWGVHLIDQMLYMIDSPLRSVYADVRNVINAEVDDYFKIILRFENRMTAEIELGTYMLSDKPGWFPRHWRAFGDKGSLYIDGLDEPQGKIVRTTRLLTDVKNEAGQYCGPTRSFGEPDEGLLVTEPLPAATTEARDYYVNFIKALKGEAELLVKPEQVRRVLQVMEAAHVSAETMRSVTMD